MPLSFQHFSTVNATRCRRWHGTFPDHDDKWTGADWSNAAAGEMGEAANVVKKLRRIELGTKGTNPSEKPELLRQLAHEIADTVTYLDLLATYYGIDLAEAVVAKFNRVSEREGFPERLTLG